jgi:carbon storage regulator
MLVLCRRAGDRIVIDRVITIEVLAIQGKQVRIGIQAPDDVSIWRQELTLDVPIQTFGREGGTRLPRQELPLPGGEGTPH